MQEKRMPTESRGRRVLWTLAAFDDVLQGARKPTKKDVWQIKVAEVEPGLRKRIFDEIEIEPLFGFLENVGAFGILLQAFEENLIERNDAIGAFRRAAIAGDLDGAKALAKATDLRSNEISQEIEREGRPSWNFMAVLAEKGRNDVINWLVQNFELDESDVHFLIYGALEGGHLDLADQFLQYFDKIPMGRAQAMLVSASTGGKVEAIERIIHGKEFAGVDMSDVLEESLEAAARSKSRESLRLLVKTYIPSHEAINRALAICVETGDYEDIDWLAGLRKLNMVDIFNAAGLDLYRLIKDHYFRHSKYEAEEISIKFIKWLARKPVVRT